MAHAFSLFPTTVPKLSMPSPHKRSPSLHRVSVLTAQEHPHKNTESVLIKMEPEPALPVLPSHLAHLTRGASPEPSAGEIGRAVTTASPLDRATPAPPAPPATTAAAGYSPSLYGSPDLHASPKPSTGLATTDSATTLVPNQPRPRPQPQQQQSSIDPSPIVPIRSIFPTYDPSKSLKAQPQLYAPRRPPLAHEVSRQPSRTSLSTPFVAASHSQWSAPASVLNFPADVMSISMGPRISTQKEVEKLWDASHGTEPDPSMRSFALEMARTDEATFVFGSHPSIPFYTLSTYDTNEIALAKTSPQKASVTRDVLLCPLEPPSRRQPPNDGLVAFLFPKLAATMAINQSAELAKEHGLAPTERDDIEAQAVRRAARQEACSLRFNPRASLYELEHPAIGRGAIGGEFAAAKSPVLASPTTIRSITGKPVVHLVVAQDGHQSSISVVDPNAPKKADAGVSTPATSAGAGLRRLSTIPQPDTSATPDAAGLASLDLTSKTLHIDANAILDLMPSLFSIDSLVSALLAVAVADPATNAVMAAMPVWKPRPAPASRFGFGSSSVLFMGRSTRPGSVKSYAGSTFYATIAERDDAEEEARLMRKAHKHDVRDAGAKSAGSRTWLGRHRSNEADQKRDKSTKKITVTEFDLEKLGHYQSGDRKGTQLPVATRSALRGLVWALQLVVWLLTMTAQVIAWLLVNVSRAVTSEKF